MKTLYYLALALLMASEPALGSTREENITVCNRTDGVSLAGTIARPESSAIKGVLILATGSGRQDRDETIMGKKPFKTLADSLGKYGYATMRFDDRGAGESGGKFETATAATYLEDMKYMLSAADSIFPNVPVGILGHSEGGWTAIQGSQDERCDFIVTLAAPAWPGDSLIRSQARAIATAATGRWDKESTQRRILDICMQQLPRSIIKMQLMTALNEESGEAAKIPDVQKQISATVEVMTSDHYREMLVYNPAKDISNVGKPWLALNGSIDMQVRPENLGTIEELNQTASTVLLPGHNHLFQKGRTGLINEYPVLDGDISGECIRTIVEWLDKTLR